MSWKNRNHAEQEDESFFVSMTDIMVGLLFIFILIIMYFALQAKMDSEKIISQEEVIAAQTPDDPGVTVQRKKLDLYKDRVNQQREKILTWLKSYLTTRGVESVGLDIQNGILRLPEGVLFDSGAYEIKPLSNADNTAKILAGALSEVLPCSVMTANGVPYRPYVSCNLTSFNNRNAGYIEAIFLEGHTDSIDINGNLPGAPLLTSNLKLSARRAANTFETIMRSKPQLIEFYAPVSSGNEPVLAVSAYGKTRPIASNDDLEGRASNRRIDLRILMHQPKDYDAYQDLLDQIGIPKGDKIR